MKSPYPYTLKFTKYLRDYDYSVREELGFTSIKSARDWVKTVNTKSLPYNTVTDYTVGRTV